MPATQRYGNISIKTQSCHPSTAKADIQFAIGNGKAAIQNQLMNFFFSFS
jgi:hypothetical protein